ncbi:MAG: glycoside hydrolase family 20 zincin-like fold domain-containing protein [Kiritimatiellae bacterium]|nr:glycoside hydrolase family 20 zincin-like fold domain-containing protein [Kiritimatiellia bacterium]
MKGTGAERASQLNIVPLPKRAVRRAGVYRLPARVEVKVSESARGELGAVRKLLEGYGTEVISVRETGSSRAVLSFGKPGFKGQEPRGAPRGEEGYVLSVAGDGVAVTGRTGAGVFWALQTVGQMLEDSRTLPCVVVEDWPDLPMRGVHLDLKGTFPTRKYLWDMIETLARFIRNDWLDFWAGFTHERVPMAKLAPERRAIRAMLRGQLRRAAELRREGVSLYRQTMIEPDARERVETLLAPIVSILECGVG